MRVYSIEQIRGNWCSIAQSFYSLCSTICVRVNQEHFTTAAILVVEEDQDLRDGLTRLLSNSGWRVLPVRPGSDILAGLECEPDLILVPVNESEFAACRLARDIRTQIDPKEEIPIVIFSAQSIPEGAERELEDRVYLVRPETFQQVKKTISRLLAR